MLKGTDVADFIEMTGRTSCPRLGENDEVYFLIRVEGAGVTVVHLVRQREARVCPHSVKGESPSSGEGVAGDHPIRMGLSLWCEEFFDPLSAVKLSEVLRNNSAEPRRREGIT